jgi:hypothetical protein
MTQLLNNYIHQLRFRIDSDAPNNYIKKFKKLKEKIENGDNNHFSCKIKDYCKLESNRNLPILNRMEGGLGGNNNIINKQIRYRHNLKKYLDNYNDIILSVQNSDIEKWTFEELDDIIYVFIKIFNTYMNTECINGCIELINIK